MNTHKLTVEFSGERTREERSSTGYCRCGWTESASVQDEVRREYRWHLEKALVHAVKVHAIAHYNDGGWDVIVEAWDDTQIAEVVAGARTEKGAIARVASIVDVYADRQADAINSAF